MSVCFFIHYTNLRFVPIIKKLCTYLTFKTNGRSLSTFYPEIHPLKGGLHKNIVLKIRKLN